MNDCFHCGLPVEGPAFPVVVGGERHDTCCRGCQAVAQTIADNGLDAYYATRSALPPSPLARGPGTPDFASYDAPLFQKSFVQPRADAPNAREAALLLDGITCAACVWLVEARLARLEGVTAVAPNYATRRLRIAWDASRTKLSTILGTIAELGYEAHPYDPARSDNALRRERRTLLWRVFVAGFSMMQVMMYAFPAYIADATLTGDLDRLLRWASLVLTLPVIAWAGAPFYRGAWRQLRGGQVGMDVPIAAGILLAFAASVFATLTGTGAVYFDSISMFVFLLLGARFLELGARAKAAAAQESLLKLAPAVAERLERFPASTEPTRVPAALLEPGDLVLVRPGAAVPADGVVVDGASSVDESLLTGESRPVRKHKGDALVGGALNKRSPLVVRIERVGAETVLSGIVRLMDRAQSERPRMAETADRVARGFVAAVLVLTVASAAAWYVVDPSQALWIAVSILVVSCPCALSLATPVALTAATGSLYGRGVLVTRGHALETLAKATHFVFDKTGTLTTGRMSLVGVMPLGPRRRPGCLALAAVLEARSEHPIARAIVEAAQGAALPQASELHNVPGRGVEAVIDGRRVRIGTPEFVGELGRRPQPPELLFVSSDVSVVALGDEDGWIALLTLGDALRGDARLIVSELKALGRTVCLLSGDRHDRVERLGRELGIGIAQGDSTPADKVEFVRALQARGEVVAMIGDGVNDAPVLSRAHVSIALGAGTALAQSSADVILVGDRLKPLASAVAVARRALRVIRQNLAWAILYNAVMLPLAVLGHVTPLVAGIGMALSSLTVALNALRLLTREDRGPAEAPPGMPRLHRA